LQRWRRKTTNTIHTIHTICMTAISSRAVFSACRSLLATTDEYIMLAPLWRGHQLHTAKSRGILVSNTLPHVLQARNQPKMELRDWK
jgi:hypothetical protein